MSEPADFNGYRRMLDRLSDVEARLKAGGGGGTSGGMEERVVRVEKAVEKLQSDVADIRVDMATVKENLRHLPTQTWLFKAMAGMVAAMAAITAVIVRFLPSAS